MDPDLAAQWAAAYVAPMLGIYGFIRLWRFARSLAGGTR